MKKSIFTIALLLGLQVSQTVGAQNEQVTLRVQNAVRPLVEKWVAEYQKTNHNTAFQIVSGKPTNTEHQISFVTEQDAEAVRTLCRIAYHRQGFRGSQTLRQQAIECQETEESFLRQGRI